MPDYFVTYNPEKFMYIVWNSQQIVLRVKDDRTQSSKDKVVEFLQQEHERLKEPLSIFEISSATGNLEDIMNALEGIRKK